MTHNNNIQETPIQTFYASQSIFITGGTGFLGKVLIEKLLRSCPNISKIYIMIRSKKNKSAMSRLDEIFESILFDRVREEMPNFRDKIVPIVQVDELNEESLGLTKDDMDLLIRNVSIVFHLAATVRFNENIKVATMINVHATHAMLNLAKRMPNLKSFIHVSTITSNYCTHIERIDECFYKYPIDVEEFITLIRKSSENAIDEKILRIASQWPNSYTFTKAMSEILVRDNSEGLSVGIFRSSVVSTTAYEPFAGWIDNYNTTMGVLVSFSKGLLRFMLYDPDNTSGVIPVDITINALIAAAWDVFNQPHRYDPARWTLDFCEHFRRGDKMMIYNSTSTRDAPLTFNDYVVHARLNNRKYPLKNCYWMPTMIQTKSKVIYAICTCFGEILPVLLVELFQRCTGVQKRIWKRYVRTYNFCEQISYFYLKKRTHTDDNVHAMWRSMGENDRCLFYFDMKGFDWSKYLENHYKGMRLYLIKDDFSTLEVSRAKWKKLYWMHQGTKIVFMFIVCVFIQKLLLIYIRNLYLFA